MLETVQRLVNSIQENAKGKATGFVISNTTGSNGRDKSYTTPLRSTDKLAYAGIVTNDVALALETALFVDGKVDYIFLDVERKSLVEPDSQFELEDRMKGKVTTSAVIEFKNNDITAESVDALVAELVPVRGSMIAILGCGNVGSKAALKLAERGATVRVYRRDQERLTKIVEGLNEILLEGSGKILVAQSLIETLKGANVLIATASTMDFISRSDIEVMNKTTGPILIDLGKGTFSEDVVNDDQFLIHRLDVSQRQKYILTSSLELREHYKKPLGRRAVDGGNVTLVSLGILGRKNEVIVDDINFPQEVIGISDGKGSLVHDDLLKDSIVKRLNELGELG